MRTLSASVASLLLLSHAASAAVVIATDNEVGAGGVGSSFTPSYTVSSTDLINGLAPSDSSGDYAFELSGGIGVLNDGDYGTITEPGGAPDRTHLAFGVAGGGSGTGTFVQWDLTGSASGYDISSIAVYGGWNDNGRDQQQYSVSYSLIGDPAFITLANVDFNPVVGGSLQSATRVTLTEDTLPFLATGVDAIRFDFFTSVENGYTGYAEFDVIGGPSVPEPGSVLLTALGSVALLNRRRRQG